MNHDKHEQLTEGYESALETISELEDAVSDLQDTVSDALSDLQGDIRTLTCILKGCLQALHHIQVTDELMQ